MTWLLNKLFVILLVLVYSVLVFPLLSLYGYIVGGDAGLATAAKVHHQFYREVLPHVWRGDHLKTKG